MALHKLHAPKIPTPNSVQKFMVLVPGDLLRRSVVAGGACVSYEGDVDIWVLAPNNLAANASGYFAALREQFRDHLKTDSLLTTLSTLKWEERPPVTEGEPECIKDGRVLFGGSLFNRKWQILATNHQTPEDLLGCFDLSVHQVVFRFKPVSTCVLGTTTQPGEIIRITNFHTPDRTFARYRKLLHRYGANVGIDHAGLLDLVRTPCLEVEKEGIE